MSTDAVILCINGSQPLNWVLAPYAHRPSANLAKRFRRALVAAVPRRTSIKRIVALARTSSGRRRLRDCYDVIWRNHNLVSMSLYAGPENATAEGWITVHHPRFRCWSNRFLEVGWLSTGDAHLGSRRRRTAFLNHYQRFLSHVGVFVVPHHGSATYFHADLVASLPQLKLGIAATGKNGYGHPHRKVREAFDGRGISFLKVSEAPSSCLAMQANL